MAREPTDRAGTPGAPDPSSRDTEPPAFGDVATHDDLVRWSADYAGTVADRFDLAVDLGLVDWEVSTRAKRRAAAVKQVRLPGVAVGTPIDWAAAIDEHGAALTPDGERPETYLRRCTVSLTWDAFVAFDRGEWAATLRHELIHVEQFQAFGTTDHGPRFRERADELDAGVTCRAFADPRYVLRCGACDAAVAGRYRDCPLVRDPERYASSCCDAPLRTETREPTR